VNSDGKTVVRDYQDLEVWQMAMDLGEQVYRLTGRFPKQEMYGLTSQIQRAAVSVPSNIAEGRMRGTTREYAHFISVARGSLAELRTQLILSRRLGYATEEQTGEILNLAERLAQRLNAWRRSLQTRIANAHSSPKTENRTPKTGRNGALR
jgi:four helix bundle protein